MIMASSVQKSKPVLPKANLQSPYLIAQLVTAPIKDHWLRLLRMCGNVFSGLQLVWIIEGQDKRGLGN